MVEPIIKHNKLILTIFNKTRNHENCVIVVDGIEYNCSSYPKIFKNKTLEFQTDEKNVVIPFKKEIIIKFE